MKTRREILKSSLGLAGIIAAGNAPAAVVRSLVAGDGVKYGAEGGDGFPYVNRGLVGMWDGIESNMSGVLTNIITGNAANIEGDSSYVFEDDLIKVTHSDGGSIYEDIGSLSTANVITVECACKKLTLSSGWAYGLVVAKNIGLCYSSDGWARAGFYLQNRYSQNIISLVPPQTSTAVIYSPFTRGNASMFVNGESRTIPSSDGGWAQNIILNNRIAIRKYSSGSSAMEFYCLRFYSRALTADEIAHNYMVDKERFGL